MIRRQLGYRTNVRARSIPVTDQRVRHTLSVSTTLWRRFNAISCKLWEQQVFVTSRIRRCHSLRVNSAKRNPLRYTYSTKLCDSFVSGPIAAVAAAKTAVVGAFSLVVCQLEQIISHRRSWSNKQWSTVTWCFLRLTKVRCRESRFEMWGSSCFRLKLIRTKAGLKIWSSLIASFLYARRWKIVLTLF